MFEYLNYGAFTITVFLTFLIFILEKSGKQRPHFLYFLLIIMYILIFYSAYDEHKTTNNNIKMFQYEDQTLKCSSGGGIYSSGTTHKVSKENGWIYENRYFTKESLVIEPHKCQKWQ